jgi:ParB-like chromosome segregation protein Spo0J
MSAIPTSLVTATNRAQQPPQVLLLEQVRLPSNPINDIDWDHVNRLAEGYERGDPIPAITVFPIEDGLYEILFGQHRFHGRRRAGKTDILATVLPKRPEPLEILALQFKENNDHRELSGMERAAAFFRAKEIGKLTNKAVAALFGVSEATVSKDLQTRESLHPTLKELCAKMELCPKKAWGLSRLPLEQQVPFYEQNKDLKSAEGMVEAVNDKLIELAGGKPKARKQDPVKCKTPNGIVIPIPPNFDHDKALAELAILTEAIKRAKRESLPMATVPMLMRSQPTT